MAYKNPPSKKPDPESKSTQSDIPAEPQPPVNSTDAEASSFKGTDIKTSIAGAKGQMCALHPWRAAHATCSYCNRPFCYQDLIEFDNSYYCMEDADMLHPEHRKRQEASEKRWAIYSGILLLLAALAFYYFSYIGIINTLGPLVAGLPKSILRLNMSSLPLILETILAALSIALAFLVLWDVGKAFYIAAMVCMGFVMVLTYSLLISGTVQMQYVAVDVVALVSLLSLLHSRITGTNARHGIRSAASTETDNMSKWGNSGKF